MIQRFFVLAFIMFAFLGCTKGSSPACEVGKTVTAVVADQIATQLACKNKSAIEATLNQKLVDLKLCEKPSASSVIGEIICPSLVSSVISQITVKIPSEWQCSGGTVKDDLKNYLLAACRSSI